MAVTLFVALFVLAYLAMASSCSTGDKEDGYLLAGLLEYEKSCQASEATGEQIETRDSDSEVDDIWLEASIWKTLMCNLHICYLNFPPFLLIQFTGNNNFGGKLLVWAVNRYC